MQKYPHKSALRMNNGGEAVSRWAGHHIRSLRMQDGGDEGSTPTYKDGGWTQPPAGAPAPAGNGMMDARDFGSPTQSLTGFTPSGAPPGRDPLPAGPSQGDNALFTPAAGGGAGGAPAGIMGRSGAPTMDPLAPKKRLIDSPAWQTVRMANGGDLRMSNGGQMHAPMYPRMANGGDMRNGTGGPVPGRGQGDKIPALYEPGEFVVSNDMLKAAPGLREELRSLRGEVLADKGTTPMEADAKAMRGGTLRAVTGIDLSDPASRNFTPPAEPALARNNNEAAASARLADANERARLQRLASAPTDPRTMTQGIDGVSGPGQKYPGRSLVPVGQANFVPETRALATTPDAGRGFAQGPTNLERDARTINQPMGGEATRGKFELAQRPVDPQVIDAETRVRTPGGPGRFDPGGASGPEPGARSGWPKGTAAWSAEGKEYLAQRAAAEAAEAGKNPAPASNPGMLRNAMGLAKSVGVGLGAGYGGSALAGLAQNIGNPDKKPAGPARAEGAESQIPRDAGTYAAPKAQPYNFFSDNETGRNVGNLLNAATPFMGGAGAARLAGYGAGAARTATAANLAGAAGLGAAAAIQEGRNESAKSLPSTAPAPARTMPDTALFGEPVDQTRFLSGADNNGKLPRDLSSLREGMIYKTKDPVTGQTIYSGRFDNKENSGGNAQFVDGKGKEIQAGGTLSIVPGMSQGQVDSALTNPDGSRVTPNDIAVMNANLRDGVNTYRGTTRGMAEEAAAQARSTNPAIAMYQKRLAEGNLSIKGQAVLAQMLDSEYRSKDARYNTDSVAKSSKYGDDVRLQVAAAPARLAEQTRRMNAQAMSAAKGDPLKAAEYVAAAGGDTKQFMEYLAGLNTSRASDQEALTKSRDNAAKEFHVYNGDKLDSAASKQAFDMARQIFPGIDSADEKTRNESMSDAKEMHAMFQKVRGQDKVGWDNAKFWEPKRPTLSSMPNVKNLRDEEVGPFEGKFTVGASNGDVLVRRKDNSTMNFGPLNERQRILLNRAQEKGWGQ